MIKYRKKFLNNQPRNRGMITKLSKEDVKLLSRLRLSVKERNFLEHAWVHESQPIVNKPVLKILLHSISVVFMPLAVGSIAWSVFNPSMRPLANIALVFLMVVFVILTLYCSLILASIFAQSKNHSEKTRAALISRSSILLLKTNVFRRVWWELTNIGAIIATAVAGHIFLATALTFIYAGVTVAVASIKNRIRTNLLLRSEEYHKNLSARFAGAIQVN